MPEPHAKQAEGHEAFVERHDGNAGPLFYAWCPSCGWHGRRFKDEGNARAGAERHDGQDAIR